MGKGNDPRVEKDIIETQSIQQEDRIICGGFILKIIENQSIQTRRTYHRRFILNEELNPGLRI